MARIREAAAADMAAIGEIARSALTLDAAQARPLVMRLAQPPPRRRWRALVSGDLDAVQPLYLAYLVLY